MTRNKLWVQVGGLTLLCLICGSCGKSAVENQQDGMASFQSRQDVIVLKVQTQGAHLSLIDGITLERPETGPALGMVSSIAVMDDYIIIFDVLRSCVEVFDRAGNYKWPIGSRGEGEGQYKSPSKPTMIPNTEQMLIYDGGTGQTLRFSVQGEFLGRLKLPQRRLINPLVVSEDRKLIYPYGDRKGNGMLYVTSLDTGEDLAKFKVCEAQYERAFFMFQRSHGFAYDEAREIIYFALSWEDKVMRIDLATRDFLPPITTNHPKFVSLKLDDDKTGLFSPPPNFGKFSRLSGMHLLPSGDILFRYDFRDPSNSTALILLSDLERATFCTRSKQ